MSKENHIGAFPSHFCIKIIGQNVITKENLVVRMCSITSMDNQCGLFKLDNETLKGISKIILKIFSNHHDIRTFHD